MRTRRTLRAATLLLAAILPLSTGSVAGSVGGPGAGVLRPTGLAAGALPSAALPSAVQPPADLTLPHDPTALLVGYVAGTTTAARAAVRTAVGGRPAAISPGAPDAERLALPVGLTVASAIARLRADPRVRYAEPDYLLTTLETADDPAYTSGDLWGMYGATTSPANRFGSDAALAWAGGATGSTAVAIGVIDEGIQITHPDLSANIWVNPRETPGNGIDDDGNGYVDDMNGWDFANDDATVYDGGTRGQLDRHGTHVAGTIGALGGNGLGVAGVAWHVTLVSGKFLARRGGLTADAVAALDYMTALKTRTEGAVNIVATNNSWGGGGYSQALQDAIQRGADAGIVFVVAAGNAGLDNDLGGVYPADYACTLPGGGHCVVAVSAIDRNGSLASWSDFGHATVDLGAPGVGIVSTLPPGTYGAYSGTSMAAPHVSGAFALCAAAAPMLTASERRAALLASVTPTLALHDRTETDGRLDAAEAVERCVSGDLTPVPPVVPGGFGKSFPSDGAYPVVRNVTLTWGTSDGADAYDVCIAPYPTACSWVRTIRTSMTLRLRGATTYQWQVRAVAADGTTGPLADGGTEWTFGTR